MQRYGRSKSELVQRGFRIESSPRESIVSKRSCIEEESNTNSITIEWQ